MTYSYVQDKMSVSTTPRLPTVYIYIQFHFRSVLSNNGAGLSEITLSVLSEPRYKEQQVDRLRSEQDSHNLQKQKGFCCNYSSTPPKILLHIFIPRCLHFCSWILNCADTQLHLPSFATHTHTHTHTHTQTCMYIYVSILPSRHTHVYIYVHTHVYIYIYIYTHTHTLCVC